MGDELNTFLENIPGIFQGSWSGDKYAGATNLSFGKRSKKEESDNSRYKRLKGRKRRFRVNCFST